MTYRPFTTIWPDIREIPGLSPGGNYLPGIWHVLRLYLLERPDRLAGAGTGRNKNKFNATDIRQK